MPTWLRVALCLLCCLCLATVRSSAADELASKGDAGKSSLDEFRAAVAERLLEKGAFEEADKLIALSDYVDEYTSVSRCQTYSALSNKLTSAFERAGFRRDYARPVVRDDLKECVGFIRERHGTATSGKPARAAGAAGASGNLDAVRACVHVGPALDECRISYIVYAARRNDGIDVADSRRDELLGELAGLFGPLR